MSTGDGLSRGKAGYLTLGLIYQILSWIPIGEGALEAGGAILPDVEGAGEDYPDRVDW